MRSDRPLMVNKLTGRKAFFFEKRKQKTFPPALTSPCAQANGQKFFGSFFQKRTFFLAPLASPT
jgi:hypothetical protein